ncbi:hypothetical protein LLG46_02390 [bacterium]|nr:hypothetical protein [bacterium]
MAADSVLASLVKIEVNSGAGYVEVKGLDKITPKHTTSDADMSTKDSTDGAGNQIERLLPARRAKSWDLEGKYYVDLSDGTRDAGQAAMEALGALTGTSAIGKFKFTPAGATSGTEFMGTVTLGDLGGGEKDDPADWNATIRYYSEVSES